MVKDLIDKMNNSTLIIKELESKLIEEKATLSKIEDDVEWQLSMRKEIIESGICPEHHPLYMKYWARQIMCQYRIYCEYNEETKCVWVNIPGRGIRYNTKNTLELFEVYRKIVNMYGWVEKPHHELPNLKGGCW